MNRVLPEDAFFWDYSADSYSGTRTTEHTEYQFPKEQTLCYSENRIADVIKIKAMRPRKSGYAIFPPKDGRKEHDHRLLSVPNKPLFRPFRPFYYQFYFNYRQFRVFLFRNSPKRTRPKERAQKNAPKRTRPKEHAQKNYYLTTQSKCNRMSIQHARNTFQWASYPFKPPS